ncbi:uncharacterized protein si:dkey-1h6.8 [Pseudorasbora parva]|uniref:uncharacterized protein si:dkey-1h6.8 n=1 Tax=Pseudorasbora parva TaxID=51549 RepID=UPI00351E0A89
MSTQETELPDCQEKVGLKRKLTGPPRLLLGKSKSRDKLEGKSQRRQRQAKCCDGTVENNDQENNDGKDNESSLISHHSPQKTSEERETQPDAPGDTSGILVSLEESESKDENMGNKMKMTRSTSKASIKRTFSSLLRCGKMKESDRTENRNKAEHNMCNSVSENKLSNANNKEVQNGKSKRRVFFTVWPISKRSAISKDVSLGSGCKEQGGDIVFQEITAPKKLTFKKIYRIFPRRKKAPHIDQFECASNATQKDVADQQNQSLVAVMDIPSIKKEENQKEEQGAENIPETFTFSADVSININTESDHMDKDHQEICPDQDVSMNKEDKVLQTSGHLDSEVPLSCCSGCSLESVFPATSSGDLLVLNKESMENGAKCRPVITIEHAYLSEEENMDEAPQFDGLTMNGSWQHLKINSLTNNTLLHPSELNVDHGRCNETLLIQTAVSMVRAAIRGAVEQLTIEQQQSLDHA